jgi:NTP pyrophosphatase (non-canonical NTP hydrolase)
VTNLYTARDVFERLQAEVTQLCREKGWRTDESGSREGYEFAAYIALLHSEATEALEAYRDRVWSETCTPTDGKHHPHCSGKPHGPGKPVGVGPELADVFIRLLDMCDIWQIDLLTETRRVLDFGWTRSYRHGGRQL